MKNIKLQIALIISLAVGIASGCKKQEACNCDNASLDANKTNIRIQNNSGYEFTSIMVNPYNEPYNCERIKPGKASCYHGFTTAYNYAYVKLFINGKQFIIQPIDYVGETPLGKGNFTYTISVISFKQGQLGITTTKD